MGPFFLLSLWPLKVSSQAPSMLSSSTAFAASSTSFSGASASGAWFSLGASRVRWCSKRISPRALATMTSWSPEYTSTEKGLARTTARLPPPNATLNDCAS
uniref:Putative secreted protein n=1 Tax=Ixodes ricinus TaxID=34613 RepID=A0A6B0U6A9_IXORI